MTCAYKIMQTGNHMRVVVSGVITPDECIGMVERVVSDPLRHLDSTALIDLRSATYLISNRKDVIRIASALETFHSVLRNNIAIVAPQCTLFPAGLVSAHVRSAMDGGIKIFPDMKSAEAFCREETGPESHQDHKWCNKRSIGKP